jgi:hypothetical protein
MDDHVGKPFKREELYAAIDRWQNGRSRLVEEASQAAA